MTEIRCRAIINWLRILGLIVRFRFPSGSAEGGCARSKPLRGKDFSRCTGRGTLTAETCKNGRTHRRSRDRISLKRFRSLRRKSSNYTKSGRPDFRNSGTTGRDTAPRQAPVPVTHIKFFASFSQERRGMAKGRRESGIHAEPRRPSRNDRQLRTRRKTHYADH